MKKLIADWLAWVYPGSLCSPPTHLRLTRLRRVARAQGGLTLHSRSKGGELGAEKVESWRLETIVYAKR
jgi:hypothetical protein